MGTEVALFDGKGLPAHLVNLNNETNIVTRESIPQLSFRGKVWRAVVGGDENIVYKTVNGQPTDEPAQVIAGVILDYNKARSRAYFEGAYEEGKTAQPTCWSHDGVKAHATVQVSPSPDRSCASCPMSQKGSKITDAGKEVTACSQFKRAVFVPIQNTKHEPMLLKLPQTSIWDKDAEEFAAKNFYAFDQYMDMLKRRGVNHTASVVTKIRFDPRTSYPKLLFGPLDWVPPEAYADIQEHLNNKENLNKILNVDPSGGEVTPEGMVPAVENAPAPTPAATLAKAAVAKAAAAKAAPAAPPPPASSDDDDGELMGRTTPPASVATPAAARAAPKPAAAKPAAAAKPPAEPAAVVEPGDPKSSGITDLLSEWDKE